MIAPIVAAVFLLQERACSVGEARLSGLLAERRSLDDHERGEAEQSLREIGPGLGSCLLLSLVAVNPQVRADAATAMGHFGVDTVAALDGLRAALRDHDHLVRASAAEALGELHASAAITDLLACLNDDDGLVRQFAVKGISRMGVVSDRVLSGLRAALDDSDGNVRHAAFDALMELGPQARPVVEKLTSVVRVGRDAGDVYDALGALGAIGPPARAALPAIDSVIHHGDDRARAVAIRTRLQITRDSHDAVQALESLLSAQRRHPDRDVLTIAALTAREIGPSGLRAKATICALAERDEIARDNLTDFCKRP